MSRQIVDHFHNHIAEQLNLCEPTGSIFKRLKNCIRSGFAVQTTAQRSQTQQRCLDDPAPHLVVSDVEEGGHPRPVPGLGHALRQHRQCPDHLRERLRPLGPGRGQRRPLQHRLDVRKLLGGERSVVRPVPGVCHGEREVVGVPGNITRGSGSRKLGRRAVGRGPRRAVRRHAGGAKGRYRLKYHLAFPEGLDAQPLQVVVGEGGKVVILDLFLGELLRVMPQVEPL